MDEYTIEPRYEAMGQGNGWYECPAHRATSWAVVVPYLGTIDAFDTLADALGAHPNATVVSPPDTWLAK